MKKIVVNYLATYKRIILLLFIVATAFTIFTFLLPTTTTTQVNDNTSYIETGYDYKAEIIPNILYPDGGTIEAGDTIFKKITSAIPVQVTSTIYSEREVTAEGTHDVQLFIRAGELWEKGFPISQEESFEQQGTNISLIDSTYHIDLDQISSFISQVQEETGIHPSQYTIELIPNIEGTIVDNGVEQKFHITDGLVFQYAFDEITLASEENFTSTILFTSTQINKNQLSVLGIGLSLIFLRISSMIISLLLLLAIIYVYKIAKTTYTPMVTSEAEKINKRYANRIVPVSQKINISQKSIFVLDSFKSIIKIADEKELPIFLNASQNEKGAVYFIVDGEYLYTYETDMRTIAETDKAGSDKQHASG